MENPTHPASEKFTAGTHVPFWVNSVQPIYYQHLGLNKEVDVVIVGGGIAGVSVAYNLSMAGKKVALVEDGFIGSGETGRTTAHLVTALDDRYYHLEKLFGEENTKLIAESHVSAIDFIERAVQKEKIDCDFKRVNGYLFLHPTDKTEHLKEEYEACLRAGLDVEQSSVIMGNKHPKHVIKFSNQGQFHSLKYLKGLCDAIVRNGGDIYTNTHAKEIDSNGITTNEGYKIKAKHVVIATNSPVNNKFIMHLKQIPVRTYVVAFKIKKGSLPYALWWDTGDFSMNEHIPPYHYARMQELDETHDLLIVGGEDHATGLAEQEHKPEEHRYMFVEDWAKQHFEGLDEVVYKWSGQIMEPVDSLAYIGHNPRDASNVFIITGDSGNGMTHATIAGMLIKDLILGKENRWEKIYSPSRFKLKSANIFLKEFVGGFLHYMRHKPEVMKESGLQDIEPNEGGVIEFEGKKIGAYRTESGQLHFVDATCTHQGCTVKWNNDEKTWDCPCHGSRFSYDGKVMNGPANKPLEYYSEGLQQKASN
jgi:glycine/D-amino acid oxidase-like deaminating enzyme/nitrite reductase/ring-hydroxylating ferredoxin subunit